MGESGRAESGKSSGRAKPQATKKPCDRKKSRVNVFARDIERQTNEVAAAFGDVPARSYVAASAFASSPVRAAHFRSSRSFASGPR